MKPVLHDFSKLFSRLFRKHETLKGSIDLIPAGKAFKNPYNSIRAVEYQSTPLSKFEMYSTLRAKTMRISLRCLLC